MLSSGLRAWGPPCLTAHFLVLFLSIQNSTQKFKRARPPSQFFAHSLGFCFGPFHSSIHSTNSNCTIIQSHEDTTGKLFPLTGKLFPLASHPFLAVFCPPGLWRFWVLFFRRGIYSGGSDDPPLHARWLQRDEAPPVMAHMAGD